MWPSTVAAYERMDTLVDYPLHLGVTEAGGLNSSCIKSAMGIGALLLQGIGDTLRVSITGDPVLEVGVAKDILRFAGKRSLGRKSSPARLVPARRLAWSGWCGKWSGWQSRFKSR